MSSSKKENIILWVIKFAPSIFVVLLVFFSTLYISNQHTYNLEKEQANIKKKYLDSYKYRMRINIQTINRYIQDTLENSEEYIQKDLHEKITNVYKIALNIYEKNKDTLNKNQIISLIKDAIEPIRFADDNGYFSIHTMEGINILHPINKAFEGTSVLNRKDVRGKYPVKEAIELAKTKGEGFFTWYYFKPNDKNKQYKKFGLVKRFEPYDLIITTAIFEEDFQKQIKNEILNHLEIIRYENNGYVFIVDTKEKTLLTKPYKLQQDPENTIFFKSLKNLLIQEKKIFL